MCSVAAVIATARSTRIGFVVAPDVGLARTCRCARHLVDRSTRRLRRLTARRIVHHRPARAHEVACGALDVEVVHDLGRIVRRDADDRRGARAGRDGVAGHEFRGAHPAAVRGAEGLVERDMLRVAAEVEPLARDDQERVAVGGGEGLEVAAARLARVEGDLGAGLGGVAFAFGSSRREMPQDVVVCDRRS